MRSKITKEDVALFIMLGGYCPKCKESPQPRYNWGVYCYTCWNKSGILLSRPNPAKDEWNRLLDLWNQALKKWAKLNEKA